MPAPSPDDLGRLIRCLPHGLRPEEAGGWTARLHLHLDDGPDHTVVIADGQVQIEDGLTGDPTATVQASAAALDDVLRGRVGAQEAFGDGRLLIDSFGDLIRISRAFDFNAVGAMAALPEDERPAPAGPTAALPTGKRFTADHVLVTPDMIAEFATATDDEHPAWYGPGAVAPPLLHARLMRDLLFGVMQDADLEPDMLRLLHVSHDVRYLQHLRPWDIVTLRGVLDHVEQKKSGLLIGAALTAFVAGEPAVEATTKYFVRDQHIAPVGTGRAARTAAAPWPAGPPTFQRDIPVPADQTAQYAAASLDQNPLHLDRETAEAAGFRDVVLHGLCTMALSGAALLKVVAFGDGRALRRLSVRWTKPVYNDSTLRLRAWRGDDVWRFDVLDAEGDAVIRDGLAVIDE
jgi:acyl dehydratase